MKHIVFLFTLLFATASYAQLEYKYIPSQRLGTDRPVKIQLPRNYQDNIDKRYPVIVVLDGNHLFEPVAGMVDYYSYWEDMPEAIVVGVNMSRTRRADTQFDNENYFPVDQGIDFYEFLGIELMDYINDIYRTADFRMIVGHDITANFMNYFLFKERPLFQGYINLSPDYAPLMNERLPEKLRTIEHKTFYYLCTSDGDIENLRNPIEEMDTYLSGIENPKFHYYYTKFDDATHYSLAAQAIPIALSDVFSIYRPISSKEYEEELLNEETDVIQYLEEKYNTITELFQLDIDVRISDFRMAEAALKKREDWADLEKLGKWASKVYPDLMLGKYYQAYAMEMLGEPKKAMRTYMSAFNLEEIAGLTKDMMLEKADAIKRDFGY